MGVWLLGMSGVSEVFKHGHLAVGEGLPGPPVVLRIVVEVPCVALKLHDRHNRRLQLLLVNLIPVYLLEPPADNGYPKRKKGVDIYFVFLSSCL